MTEEIIAGVPVVHWNPRKSLVSGRLARFLPFGPRRNNFGDVLGPALIQRIVAERGLRAPERREESTRLISIGSVMHFARNGDTVWGSGINGKVSDQEHTFANLDVRSVRGPLTRRALMQRGIAVPEVFGDPGLLAPVVFNDFGDWSAQKQYALTIVPNLHDYPTWADHENVVDPTAPLMEVLERIARSERVVGSSLHGLVIAESCGVPATLIRPQTETLFKYEDYYRGTGRETFPVADDLPSALAQAADGISGWSAHSLLAAFPQDLWTSDGS